MPAAAAASEHVHRKDRKIRSCIYEEFLFHFFTFGFLKLKKRFKNRDRHFRISETLSPANPKKLNTFFSEPTVQRGLLYKMCGATEFQGRPKILKETSQRKPHPRNPGNPGKNLKKRENREAPAGQKTSQKGPPPRRPGPPENPGKNLTK